MGELLGALAEVHRLHDFVGVDAVRERLANPLVAEERHVRVVRPPSDVRVAVVRPLVELQVVGLRQIGHVAGLDEAGGDLAGLQLRREHGRVGDHLLHPLVEERDALPVRVVAAEDDLVTLPPLLELERAARHRRGVVLGRLVHGLRGVVVHGVLAEDVLRHRSRTEDVRERRAEDPGELHRELLGVRCIDRDPGDARGLAGRIVLVSLDVVEHALVRGDLAAPLHLHPREEIIRDDRLAVGPIRLRVDGPAEREAIGADGPAAEPRLDLARLVVGDDERVVDLAAHSRRRRVVGRRGIQPLDVREVSVDDPATGDRLLVRRGGARGLASAAGRRARRRDERERREARDEDTARAMLLHAPLLLLFLSENVASLGRARPHGRTPHSYTGGRPAAFG